MCEICKGIDDLGAITDIIEMDAASNNGVDDIRDLRDEVDSCPRVCRYKVLSSTRSTCFPRRPSTPC